MLGVDRLALGGPRQARGDRRDRQAGAAVRAARGPPGRGPARAVLGHAEGAGAPTRRRGRPARRRRLRAKPAPKPPAPPLPPAEAAAKFRETVDLRVAKIVEVARHPKADKLYVETVDLGHGASPDRLGPRALLPRRGARRALHRAGREPQAREAAGRGEQRHAARRAAGRAGGRAARDRRGPVRRPRRTGRPGACSRAATPRLPRRRRSSTWTRSSRCRSGSRTHRPGGRSEALLCGAGRAHREGGEGQGAVIELSVRAAPLSALDASPELLQSGYWAAFKAAHRLAGAPLPRLAGDVEFPLLVLTRRIARLFRARLRPLRSDPSTPARIAASSWRVSPAPCGRTCPAATFLLRFDLPWLKAGEPPRGRPGCARRVTTSSRPRRCSWTSGPPRTGSSPR